MRTHQCVGGCVTHSVLREFAVSIARRFAMFACSVSAKIARGLERPDAFVALHREEFVDTVSFPLYTSCPLMTGHTSERYQWP